MKRPGLTLPEMMISIVVIGIVMVVCVGAYLTTAKVVRRESDRSTVTLGTGRVLGPLDTLLRQGRAIVTQYPPAPGVATVTTGTDALVFTVPSLVGSTLTDANDYITLVRDTTVVENPRLIMTVYPDATSSRTAGETVIATYVADLYLRYPDIDPTAAENLTITVRLNKGTSSETAETLILNATLRNAVI